MAQFIVFYALLFIIKVFSIQSEQDLNQNFLHIQHLSSQNALDGGHYRHQPVFESSSVWTYDGILINMPEKERDVEEALEEEDYNYEDDYDDLKQDNQNYNSSVVANTSLKILKPEHNIDEIRKVSKDKSNASKSYLIIDQPLVNITEAAGQKIKLKCSFKSHPQSIIKWFKNEAFIKQLKGKISIRTISNKKDRITSRLLINHVDIHDTGYYKCEANNSHQIVETIGILIVDSEIKSKESNQVPINQNYPHSFSEFVNSFQDLSRTRKSFTSMNQNGKTCKSYHGEVCSQFIGNKSIFIKNGFDENVLEANLKTVFNMIANSYQVSPQCHRFAIPSLCFATFPLCEENLLLSSLTSSVFIKPTLKKICRDECEILETEICHQEFHLARDLNLFDNKIILDCKQLPVLGSPEHQHCIKLGVPSSVQLIKSHVCYQNHGRDYRGLVSKSITGKPCLSWNSVYNTIGHSELIGGHNFCRNPDGLESQPWCFVNEQLHIKELCDISQCGKYSWLKYILIPSIIALLLLLSILSFCFYRKWSIQKAKQPSNFKSIVATYKSYSSSHDSSKLNFQKNTSYELNQYSPKLSNLKYFTSNCIKMREKLFEGDFGDIYIGEVLIPNGVVIPVAIRTLRLNSNSVNIHNFKSEANLLASLQHPNIVCLIGVCFSEIFMAMLFEYACECNLLQFLIKYSPKHEIKDGKSIRFNYLKILDLLHIAIQIAAGLEYLSMHHYTHRALASQNCLITDYMTVKILNFKLNPEDYSSDYYCIPNNQALPIRWLPPESIFYENFTTSSDVWSYGVVLWEIFSFGKEPYSGYSNQQVIELVKDCHFLPCPENCPPHFYSLMIDCWRKNPKNRPTSTEIHNKLKAWQAMENVRSNKTNFRKISTKNLVLNTSNNEQFQSVNHKKINEGSVNRSSPRYNKRNLVFTKDGPINFKSINVDKNSFDFI